eukprot:5642967-Prymnesium_polylepis.2
MVGLAAPPHDARPQRAIHRQPLQQCTDVCRLGHARLVRERAEHEHGVRLPAEWRGRLEHRRQIGRPHGAGGGPARQRDAGRAVRDLFVGRVLRRLSRLVAHGADLEAEQRAPLLRGDRIAHEVDAPPGERVGEARRVPAHRTVARLDSRRAEASPASFRR